MSRFGSVSERYVLEYPCGYESAKPSPLCPTPEVSPACWRRLKEAQNLRPEPLKAVHDTAALPTSSELNAALVACLDENKAEDIVSIDLKDKSALFDTMIIASARSQRHVAAIADHVTRRLKELGLGRVKVEGMPHCDWVLVDAGDVIVHIMRPQMRELYPLERLWADPSPQKAAAHH